VALFLSNLAGLYDIVNATLTISSTGGCVALLRMRHSTARGLAMKKILATIENRLLSWLLDRLENRHIFKSGPESSGIVDACLYLQEVLP